MSAGPSVSVTPLGSVETGIVPVAGIGGMLGLGGGMSGTITAPVQEGNIGPVGASGGAVIGPTFGFGVAAIGGIQATISTNIKDIWNTFRDVVSPFSPVNEW